MLNITVESKEKLAQAWDLADELSEGFQKSLLEVSYTLYPDDFEEQVKNLLQKTSSPAVFVRCAEYLLLSGDKAQSKRLIKQKQRQTFSGSIYAGLAFLQERLEETTPQQLPPLSDLFSPSFLPGQVVIYSLQRKNRNYPGLVLIRGKDGSFLKDSSGQLFHVPQLARSITAYPFYITNGNTPQGIYRWTGFDTSTNNYIGPTTNLQMSMPYEVSPAMFFNDSLFLKAEWSESLYRSLLPRSWHHYTGIYESYKAGKIGRSEIIMHGTTINPFFYKAQSYFPQTPSLGCLCSFEEWSDEGRQIKSDQERIVSALLQSGSKEGYVVVVDLDDQRLPVSPSAIQLMIER